MQDLKHSMLRRRKKQLKENLCHTSSPSQWFPILSCSSYPLSWTSTFQSQVAESMSTALSTPEEEVTSPISWSFHFMGSQINPFFPISCIFFGDSTLSTLSSLVPIYGLWTQFSKLSEQFFFTRWTLVELAPAPRGGGCVKGGESGDNENR